MFFTIIPLQHSTQKAPKSLSRFHQCCAELTDGFMDLFVLEDRHRLQVAPQVTQCGGVCGEVYCAGAVSTIKVIKINHR